MNWTKATRASGLIEHVCEHGVGHPDPASAAHEAARRGHDTDTWLIHGCDGCCGRPDFPGSPRQKVLDELTAYDQELGLQ